MTSQEATGEAVAEDHLNFMRTALGLAENSPPKHTNFRVGALLVNLSDGSVTAHGYTLELAGNTHAEQCCLLKLADQYQCPEEDVYKHMSNPHALYTTLEPCYKRLSGNMPCVERVLRQKSWIKKVYVGVEEPETFVGANTGRKTLEEAGIEVNLVPGLEDEILKVAKAGHVASG